MRFLNLTVLVSFLAASFAAAAETHIVDGRKYECSDGVCRLVEEGEAAGAEGTSETGKTDATGGDRPRMAQGYMSAEAFVAFLENREAARPFAGTGAWLTLLLVLLGGIAMNLTPCVLPMIPINVIVIGRSARRGAAYGLGMAIAYGALGVAAALGGLAFGDIQGSPWFNAAVAFVFVVLALALFGVFFIDLSRFRPGPRTPNPGVPPSSLGFQPFFAPFFMGALSAVLAGACVAPILISVLLLTGKLYAGGCALALGLPFVLGLGMALPWPFLGAGLKVLPKPGAWMKNVNRVFGVIVLGFAVWYGHLAWQGFSCRCGGSAAPGEGGDGVAALHLRIPPPPRAKPVLVDCWASWCKNCAAMDRVLETERVKKTLERFTVIRVQAEDLSELRKVKGFESIRGLPAFVLFE